MATQSGVFTFSLPEDTDSDQLLIYSSSTEDGIYSLDTTVSYEYGETTYEYDSLDDTKWYKIKFNNSTDSEAGPLSDAVYGGNFSQSSPFLAVSTTTDGANYATTEDVYDYGTFTTEDVTAARVSQALRRARAIIDLKTADLDLDRFTKTFNTETSRKKYNATLRVLKEAEINIALGMVYRGMADDLTMKKHRQSISGDDFNLDKIAIGGQMIDLGDEEAKSGLDQVADRYTQYGYELLNALQPPSVRLHFQGEYTQSPKFKYPFNGY